MHDAIRHTDLQSWDSGHAHSLTRQNRLATGESVWIHTILDDGLLIVVLLQVREIALGLVRNMLVMALQVIDCIL